MYNVIDLFAGCGGFSTGFKQAGYSIIKAVEYDEKIAESYSKNHPNTKLLVSDIGEIDNNIYFNKGEADVIIGGPPCQGFSMAGNRIRSSFISDERNYLFKHYINVIKIVKPKVFVFENVKGILSMNNGDIFKEIIKEFSDPNNFEGNCYNVSYKIIKCQDFGIPQKRERLILIGTLNVKIDLDEEIIKAKLRIKEDFPDFFITQTVWDAISNLPDPKSDGTVLINGNNSSYQDYLFSNIEVKNHYETTHSLITKERMNKIKENENFMVLNEEIKSVHSGSYGRLSKTDICPTITTRFDTPSGGRFIHPASNRTLTPREAARIQSFPDSFIFYGNKTIIHKEIGNAVPPKISRFLGELIKGVLNEQFK